MASQRKRVGLKETIDLVLNSDNSDNDCDMPVAIYSVMKKMILIAS